MTKPKPRLTKELFHESLVPPNNCRVKAFMETLDPDSLAVLEEAMRMPKAEFPSSSIVTLLLIAGFEADSVPGNDAFSCHRQGRRPCKCKG
jgi:hypothetical protein